MKKLLRSYLDSTRHPLFILPMVSIILTFSWLAYIHENRHLDIVDASENIIQNGSFDEQDASGFALGWTTETTGEVTAQKNSIEGFVSGRGVRLDVTNYSSGTASIVSPVLNTEAGKTYFFKSYYATDSVTDIYIRSINASNSVTTTHARHLPDYDYPWSAMSTTFTAMSDKTQIVIAVSAKGYIELDSAYVKKTGAKKLTFTTNGVDLLASQARTSWKLARIGEYTVDAKNDQAGIVLAVNNFISGSASYKPQAVSATPHTQYELTFDYENDVPVSLYVDYELEDGTYTYQFITTLQPTTQTTLRTIRFESPARTRSLAPSVQISSNGMLKQTMMTLKTNGTSQTYDKPRVSITFDDGWLSSYTNGAQVLSDVGMTATFYINPGTLGRAEIMSESQARDVLARGFELGSHNNEHIDITSFTQDFVDKDLSNAVNILQRLGVEGKPNYASPYGKFDDSVLPLIMNRSNSHRGTDIGINTKNNIDTSNLKALFMRKELTDEQLEAMLQETKNTNGWLILIYHQIEASQSPFALDRETFRRQVEIVKKSGIDVMTVSQALNQVNDTSE